ncbi:BCCT family transporter [Chakrabartyella piscis]|uniref:BCCT family transporter n=1 Tax=Chakrabartyella piscis TaxID=2918914 RepID=UPI002958CF97|nr:BCCT family transporter [Chakrabartyella piscis]
MKKENLKQYEMPLMIISIAIILFLTAMLTIFPDQSNALANDIFQILTRTFCSPMVLISVIITTLFIGLALSKYGNIRLGTGKPEFSTFSWLAMIFFCVNGAGTMYWAFIEWPNLYLAAPQLNGVAISDDFALEMSTALNLYNWGPNALVWLLIFNVPFAYWYYVKKENTLQLSAICAHGLPKKMQSPILSKVIDFVFIFSVVGSIAITAGSAASTVGIAIAKVIGIEYKFTIAFLVLFITALIFSLSSFVGIDKGMKNLCDKNVYVVMFILVVMLVAGNGKFMIDQVTNSFSIMADNWFRILLWTDPVTQNYYPQDWTVFYFIYNLVFAPLTAVFATKISRGRTIRELTFGSIGACALGIFCLHGFIGTYGQSLLLDGTLDIVSMVANGDTAHVASEVMLTLPLPKIMLAIYCICTIVFLASTLDASAFSLAAASSKKLAAGAEPNKFIKMVWCIVLIGIPTGIAFAGTNTNTLKSFVLAFGVPLILLIAVCYRGVFADLKEHYSCKTKEEIMLEGYDAEMLQQYKEMREKQVSPELYEYTQIGKKK